jgi:hypothetical protein
MLLPSLLSVVHRPYHNPHSTLRHLNTAHAHLDREAASHERFNHLFLLRERHDAVVGHQHAAPRPHDLREERRTRQQGHGDGVTVVGLRWWGYGGGVTVAGLRWRGYGGGAGGEDGGAGGEDGGAQEAKMVVQEVTVSLTMALFLHFASTFTSSASRKFLSTRMVCRVQGAGCRAQGVGGWGGGGGGGRYGGVRVGVEWRSGAAGGGESAAGQSRCGEGRRTRSGGEGS